MYLRHILVPLKSLRQNVAFSMCHPVHKNPLSTSEYQYPKFTAQLALQNYELDSGKVFKY